MPDTAPSRSCPRCSTPQAPLALRPAEGAGVVLDHCPRCRGVWLDHEEWAPVVGVAREVRAPDAIRLAQPPECPACPSGGPPMHPRGIDGVEDVEIDICGRCGGAWLDGGELQALRSAMARRARERRRRSREAAPAERRRAAHAGSEDEAFDLLEALRDTWRTLWRS